MKRILMMLIIAGAALIISNPTNAQGYYTTYSYSYTNYNDWDLPYHVRNVVAHHYNGCGIVNARSYYVGGHLAYNLFLNTGNTYVEIEVDRFGYVTRRVSYNTFPTHHVWVRNHSVYYKPKYHHGNKHYYKKHKKHHHGHHGHNNYTTNNYYIDYSSANNHGKSYQSDNNTNDRVRNSDKNHRKSGRDVQNSRYDRNTANYAYRGR